jgi:hypothetical protein
MVRIRCSFALGAFGSWLLTALLLCGFSDGARAAEKSFPFDHELRFDANPQRGSKRLPGLQIAKNGTVEIDLWCASGRGQAVIVDKSLAIVPTALKDNQCSQERLRLDEEFLMHLTQVTAWKWEGDLIVLIGPKPLRFRPASN